MKLDKSTTIPVTRPPLEDVPSERDSAATRDTKPIKEFIWGAGIECSFIPHLRVDQFEWTQHDRFWRDDFKRAREELGLSALRYALPWHKIEVRPGVFDWAAADERVAGAAEMGLDLYLDVMHFGTPLWLKQAAGDPEFPEALERFTTALVERYSSSVKNWCPCNEPLVLALFSGDFGFWPPHSRRWKGYMPVLSRVVQAVSRSIRAVRRVDGSANVLLCDHIENYRTRSTDLDTEVRRRNLRRFLALDLLLGRVDRHHPMFNWLTGYGMSELDLDWFRSNPQSPDILGLDYYPNSEWQLDRTADGIRQRRSESPIGLFGIAREYYNRYALPMMLTETSADGHPINREIWLDETVNDCRKLREEGIPMLGYFWWPMVDQVDWDGALTHRVGKIHEVGAFRLSRQADGTLTRHATPLVKQLAGYVARRDDAVGKLGEIALPVNEPDQGPPIGIEIPADTESRSQVAVEAPAPGAKSNGNGSNRNGSNGNGAPVKSAAIHTRLDTESAIATPNNERKTTDRYGMVVFSHLRWGFVWQRPQQFLSRFAKLHKILFVEEPIFDLGEGAAPRLDFHKVMPNVTVICTHLPPSWARNAELPALLRKHTHEAIDALNDDGEFDKPLLWYYSPMDSGWSLGHFENRGVVYDCMDELSQFTGAPPSLLEHEARLMRYADVVFTGGYELGEKKRKQHDNVHIFGCGVDYAHFSAAREEDTAVPPDIDFMARPILGWMGVVDERVDYALVAEMAKLRQGWSFAMVGPVVKMDPKLLPHAPNLFWLGGRDYQQLPHYCRAFDVNMMCFAINAATQFINPTKGLEYMATGKPIVSTPVRDVVRQWSDVVRIATTPAEFVAAAEEAMAAGPQDERIVRGTKLALQSSWESTVASMQDLIRKAITATDRRSGQKIEPLSGAALSRPYAATQGS